jgi:alkylated DNA repair dioxygenase AlkB
MQQSLLFTGAALPELAGLRFLAEFLSAGEERDLLKAIDGLTLAEAQYKQYTARRRVAGFGGKFDYDSNELRPAPPIPGSLVPLRERVAQWLGVNPSRFEHMLVAEYRPGTPLGWHRDVPDFESIVGVSLLGTARLKFRPYPPAPGRSKKNLTLELPPRSVYVLEGPVRWQWQHCIAQTTELRYSISLRTRRSTPLLLPQGDSPAAD